MLLWDEVFVLMVLWCLRRSVDEEGWFLVKDCVIVKLIMLLLIMVWVKFVLCWVVLENSFLKVYDVVGVDVNSVGEVEDSDKVLIRGCKGVLCIGIFFYVWVLLWVLKV